MNRKRVSTASVKLDSRMRARLRTLSRLKQRSQHWLMREAIDRYLDEEESAEQLKRETLERWERYETDGEHVSNAAIKAWLESWGTAEQEGQCPHGGE